jgi:hypothetical protein
MTDEKSEALTAEEIAAWRERIRIPEPGLGTRKLWFQLQLANKRQPRDGTKSDNVKWSQAAIARVTHSSEPHVSRVLSGGIVSGALAGRIRRKVSEILEIPEDVLFPSEAGDVCPRCGQKLPEQHAEKGGTIT